MRGQATLWAKYAQSGHILAGLAGCTHVGRAVPLGEQYGVRISPAAGIPPMRILTRRHDAGDASVVLLACADEMRRRSVSLLGTRKPMR